MLALLMPLMPLKVHWMGLIRLAPLHIGLGFILSCPVLMTIALLIGRCGGQIRIIIEIRVGYDRAHLSRSTRKLFKADDFCGDVDEVDGQIGFRTC